MHLLLIIVNLLKLALYFLCINLLIMAEYSAWCSILRNAVSLAVEDNIIFSYHLTTWLLLLVILLLLGIFWLIVFL